MKGDPKNNTAANAAVFHIFNAYIIQTPRGRKQKSKLPETVAVGLMIRRALRPSP
jgi:hypothetical protein